MKSNNYENRQLNETIQKLYECLCISKLRSCVKTKKHFKKLFKVVLF